MTWNLFDPHQVLRLVELSESLGLESPEFVVEQVLRGGMGACARIRNLRDRTVYALKAMDSALIGDDTAWERWLREMHVWLQLSSHAGVVPAYCICRINELPCVAAKWMEGGNLRPRLIDRTPTLFYRTALRVAHTLAWAYSEHRIVHRDLKPENLLCDAAGIVSVSDWGIARFGTTRHNTGESRAKGNVPRGGSSLTEVGEFVGTAIYASPEQILGQPEIDHRSDIYSLGCVLFEWESGHPPFVGNDLREIAYQHLHVRPPRLRAVLRRTTFGAESIILRCLEKNPRDRYQDYAELVTALDASAAKKGVALTDPVPSEQYRIPRIGEDQYQEVLVSGVGALPQVRSRDGRFALLSASDIEPFIREVEVLLGLNQWGKAERILAHLYVPGFPLHFAYTVTIAANYALCLLMLGRASDAVTVFDRFSTISDRPCAVYLNHSLALLQSGDAQRAEQIALEGLARFPDDIDLLGNLTIAQLFLKKLPEALANARRRLAARRDVHALEETASVLRTIASDLEDRDLPAAAAYYWEGLALLQEVKNLNPRYHTARASRAGILGDLGFLSESMEEASAVLHNRPHPDLGRSLALTAARALSRSGAHGKCVEFCDRWLKEYPDDIALQRIRAETLVDRFSIGTEREGVRIVEPSSLMFFEARVSDPAQRMATDFLYLAKLREWMGDLPAAKTLLDLANAERADWWEPAFVLAGFEWRLGNLSEARRLMKLAATLGPWRPQPWRGLETILRSAEQTAEAEEVAARALYIERKRDELLKKQLPSP